MTDYFTSCLQRQVEVVKGYLQGLDPPHVIIEVLGPFDQIGFQYTDDVPVYCGGQVGNNSVMMIHSQQ